MLKASKLLQWKLLKFGLLIACQHPLRPIVKHEVTEAVGMCLQDHKPMSDKKNIPVTHAFLNFFQKPARTDTFSDMDHITLQTSKLKKVRFCVSKVIERYMNWR